MRPTRPDPGAPQERVLPRVLERQAEIRPHAPYVMAGDAVWSYSDVHRHANGVAASLAGLGVGPGDTVAILMEPGPEFVVAQFGINRLGAVWVPVNTDFRGEWLADALLRSRARVLLVDGGLVERVAACLPSDARPFSHVAVYRGLEGARIAGATTHDLAALLVPADQAPEASVGWGDTAAVLWTSGTTGRSKGVMQPHNAWITSAERGARTAATTSDDVLYSCLPMYNSAAWVSVVYRALVCGIPFGLDARFSVEGFWDRVRHYGATQIFTLGAMHMFLWNAPQRPDDAANPVSVASCIPMPEELIEPFKARFGIESVFQGYGQSEMLGVFARPDDGTAWESGTMGRAHETLEVALLDADDREVPEGEVGEICVRPLEPYVMFNGYLDDPDATAAAVRNLWYHTGDLGRRSGDQYFFVDRRADYIRFKGRNVSSLDVERVVSAHPDVVQVAAYGVVSELLESEAEIKVDVVLREGSTVSAADIARHVNERAPYFMVPRFVEIVSELPQTPTGRVQKYRLRTRGVTAATWDRDTAGFEVVR